MDGKLESHPTQQLRYYHRNPHKGDVNAITDSIIQNGIYKPLVVNRGTHTQGDPWKSPAETTPSKRYNN